MSTEQNTSKAAEDALRRRVVTNTLDLCRAALQGIVKVPSRVTIVVRVEIDGKLYPLVVDSTDDLDEVVKVIESRDKEMIPLRGNVAV